MSKTLVIFFSRAGENYVQGRIENLPRGNTEIAVGFVREATSADVFRVETVKEYPARYRECTDEAALEQESGEKPELKNRLTDISAYDKVVLAGPIWWGTFPMAVLSAVQDLDFSSKTVYPLATHEGSGLGGTADFVRRHCKGCTVGEGLAIQGASVGSSRARIGEWVKRNAL